MKTLIYALGAALVEITKPDTHIQTVEVYYTLLADGYSEMWTEEYSDLEELIEDFKFFSRYRGKSVIKVLKKGSKEIVAAYQLDSSTKSAVTLMGDLKFAEQLKIKLFY